MEKPRRLLIVKKRWGKVTPAELAEEVGVSVRTIQRDRRELNLPPYQEPSAADYVNEHRQKQKISGEKRKSRELSRRVVELEREVEAAKVIVAHRGYYKLPKPMFKEDSMAVAVVVASDWHIEEIVKPEQVSNLNEFNEEVCKDRIRRFFHHTLKMVQLSQQSTHIETLVLALIGDFISNGLLHDELLETNRLSPVSATLECKEHISSGIRYLLDNSDLRLVIPTHSGNHGRVTRRVRWASEAGNSLEHFMYCALAKEFENEERVEFLVSEGQLSYVKIWDNFTIRFLHGTQVRYNGGIGGLSIPMRKAVAAWNKGRHADLTVCGHFHQFVDGGDFIVNGSLVGYSAFALSIKASPEPPRQAFFLIDSRVGKTLVAPIILTEDR